MNQLKLLPNIDNSEETRSVFGLGLLRLGAGKRFNETRALNGSISHGETLSE